MSADNTNTRETEVSCCFYITWKNGLSTAGKSNFHTANPRMTIKKQKSMVLSQNEDKNY